MPSNVRSRSWQRCSPTRNGRFARPCDRSTYTYMPSGRSPARLVSFSRVPPRCGPDRDRAWHLWSSSSREECPRLRYRSTRRCSRVFRSPFASRCRVAGIPAPCLTRVCRRNPRTASPRVTPLSARPLSPLPHYMLNPFRTTQQALTDAACSKVEIFDLRTVRPFRRSYTFSTNLFSSARRRAASASSPCITAYSSNALDPPTCRAEASAEAEASAKAVPTA